VRRYGLVCIALSVLVSVFEIAVAVSLVPILDSLGIDAGGSVIGLFERIPPPGWLALFALAAAARSTINWQFSLQEELGTQNLIVSLQARLYGALAVAHWDIVRRTSPPEISSALHTKSYDAGYGFSSLVGVISATLLVIGYLISSAAVFPLALPALLIGLALIWRLNSGRDESVYEMSEDYGDAQTELQQRYEDWVAINRITSLGVNTGDLSDRFESGARTAAAHAIGFTKSSAATRVTYDIALVIAILVGVPVAWWLEAPPALLVFGLILFVRVLPRAASIQSGYQGVLNAIPPMRAIESLAERLEADAVQPFDEVEPIQWQVLTLVNLGIEDTVRDSGQHWILRDIDLELAHGEWIALSGPTGAGKTTLAEVMLMLLRPDAGLVRIDGDIVDEELAARWRHQAAYVPQDVVLFDASIRDNLKLYVPDASDEELGAALRQSAAEFVMERLPEGLDTRAGPGGRMLSGGERQRIGIARALLREPGFLVLDEPTAALDGNTQQKLMDALRNLDHRMSVVIITHRPELLKLVDRVIEIEDGRIDADREVGRAPS
jgi:ATP-binding cassette subfamily C protein